MAGRHIGDLNNSTSSKKIVNYAHRSFSNRCVCPLSTYSCKKVETHNLTRRRFFRDNDDIMEWPKGHAVTFFGHPVLIVWPR